MKIIGRASAVNLELDAGGIVNVFTTAAIAVPFDQTNVEVVDNDGHHKYLIELAEVTSYTPEGGVETVFSGTRDQLIDILNEQFFTGGTGAGGGFTPTTDVLQSQIVNFNIDTVANAKALTYELNDRVYIEELDEVFQAKSVPSGITATGSPTQVGTDLYTISHTAGTYGQILRIDAQGNLYNDHQFTATGAVGNKPVGTLLYANGLLYIETTEGGANNLGTLMTFDPLTKAVSKVIDFSTTLGYSQGVLTPLQNNDKVLVDTDKLYLITGDGGAHSKGTILKVDLATNTGSVILDLNTTGLGVTTSKGFAVAVSGVYYAFVEDQAIKVDIATDTVTSLHVEASIVGNGKALAVGFYDSSVNTVYLGFDGDSGGLASYDIATDTYTYKTSSSQPDTYMIFKDGNILYGLEWSTGALYGWDLVGGTITPSSAHTFPTPQIMNGSFNASTGILYFTQGTSYTTQDKIYKYDVATKTTTLIKDLSIGGVTGDDQFIISVNQAGLYLQVRDNHIKSLSVVGNTATFYSTRGVETTLTIDGNKVETIKNNTYPSASTYYTINTQGSLSVDFTVNCGQTATINGGDFYDFGSSSINLVEGKYYQIEANVNGYAIADQNRLTFALEKVSTSSRFSRTSVSTTKFGSNRFSFFFAPFVADATHATNGIKFFLDEFQGGTGFRVFNIKLEITEL